MRTVYVSIGNSDDKLTQREWALFYREVNVLLRSQATTVHGQWVSEPASAWQNACWCVELPDSSWVIMALQRTLKYIAFEFRQESIAWAEVSETVFLEGEPSSGV